MSSVNPFATQIAQSGQASTALAGAKTSGVTASGGAFWEFLFSLVGTEGSEAEGDIFTKIAKSPEDILGNTKDNVLQNAKSKMSEGKPLSLSELALMFQEQDKEIPVNFKELNIEEVSAKIDELNKTINDMVEALPADAQSNPFAELLVNRLQHRLEDLQTSLDAIETIDDEQLTTLISFGLTPSQITDAVDRIHEVEDKIGRPLTAEDLIAGVGGILQPVGSNTEEDLQPTDELAELLNSLSVGDSQENETSVEEDGLDISDNQNFAFEDDGEDTSDIIEAEAPVTPPLPASQNPVLAQFLLDKLTSLPEQADPTEQLAAQLNSLDVGAGEELSDGDFRTYKGLDLIAKLATTALDPSGAGKKAGHIMKASFADLIQANTDADGDLSVPKGFFNAFFEGSSLSSDQDIATVLPMTHAAQAAHSVTSIPQAGQTHPATQMVSATITKMAKDGGPKSMRIELDPPELGRVNVTLEFGPEKTTKIHVLAEKPETYFMLQRDAALLERALQDTGLNADSASLSFELAEDGSAFNSNQDNNSGGSNGRRANAGQDDSLEIIHSTVNWQIDPETGLTRYNIVA